MQERESSLTNHIQSERFGINEYRPRRRWWDLKPATIGGAFLGGVFLGQVHYLLSIPGLLVGGVLGEIIERRITTSELKNS